MVVNIGNGNDIHESTRSAAGENMQGIVHGSRKDAKNSVNTCTPVSCVLEIFGWYSFIASVLFT